MFRSVFALFDTSRHSRGGVLFLTDFNGTPANLNSLSNVGAFAATRTCCLLRQQRSSQFDNEHLRAKMIIHFLNLGRTPSPRLRMMAV